MTDRQARLDRWLTPSGAAVIPPRVAYWIETQAGLTAERRVKIRLTDPDAYDVLMALHSAAMHYDGSDNGTETDETHYVTAQSDEYLTTTQLAEILGVTDRAIRKAIARQRIPAEQRGRQYFIHPAVIDQLRNTA